MTDRPVFHPELGAYFARLREEKGWSQRRAGEVAHRRRLAAVNYQAIQRLEAGKTRDLGPDLLRALAALYDVTYESLVRRWAQVRYGVDVEAEAPVPANAETLTPDERACLQRWRALGASDRAWLDQTLDRLLGVVGRGNKFRPWSGKERRAGKDRRAS